MLLHYLKIAFRNMWKYKSQTLISVIGLAVGFTCFALAALWIRYEMTYDSFHKNAEQMYVVYKQDSFSPSGYSRNSLYPLAAYLKETFPEITDAIPLEPSYREDKVTVEGVEYPALTIRVDSSFFRMFDVKILEGSRDFLIPDSKKLAITQEKAKLLFGNENPIGKTVNNGQMICAIVSGMPKRSNYAFDFIGPFSAWKLSSPSWNWSATENTVIKLFPGTNIEAFEKKLYEHHTGEERGNINKMMIKPLTKLRYLDPDITRDVKFQHILIFAVSGLLVIVCALFNYLTLFVSRFRIRQKELALRMVCGASGGSLLVMLSVEFMLTVLIAALLGGMLTQWLHKPFLALSDIQMNLPAIYRESLVYIGTVILIALLVFWLILFIFRRRSLNLSIRRSNKNLSRKVSIIVQLIISIGFAFCTIVIFKQMYFLHHTDELGFSFQNRAAVVLYDKQQVNGSVLANHLKQIPEIAQVVDADDMQNLVPPTGHMSFKVDSWDDKPVNAGDMDIEKMHISIDYCAFYNFKLVDGEMLTDACPDSLVLINESAVKAFGWHDPVGKHFRRFKVQGVIKNVYNLGPTVPAKPVYYSAKGQSFGESTVLFKYKDGMWKSCKEKIEQILKREYANLSYTSIINTEEEYNKFLKSEDALIKLLSFVSAICIVICIFGFVSMVLLTCEERRKAIAIRKINGATVGDILSIFAKEYFLLLIIGATIAFSTSYFIMKRWLENYVKQTSIPTWIYLSILFALALIIVLSVGWQVYKTSVENPAEVVKKE